MKFYRYLTKSSNWTYFSWKRFCFSSHLAQTENIINYNQWQKLWNLHPLSPYSMLVANLSVHFWSPLPGMASSGLTQHWVRGKGGFWVTLSKSNVFWKTFLWKYGESQLFLSLIVGTKKYFPFLLTVFDQLILRKEYSEQLLLWFLSLQLSNGSSYYFSKLIPFLGWLLTAQTQYRNMNEGCEGILPQGKGPHNSRNLRKLVAIYKTGKLILSKKSLSLKTRGSEKYLAQKVAAPNLFSLSNQLHILCFWYHFEE